ncbi:hypothetical protein PGTUg99_035958 [Puccinia graminis f. sp. tritici]|uniref:Uncharacterized protein n=1 Tax=Puccinia graminis f. sp. tritici TaxID=56615 RepID=A0A5B0RN56_PUCGR|nr:hypothetical protein PGTUg99_035958 [Puccinia graminis f. sp. tritici]
MVGLASFSDLRQSNHDPGPPLGTSPPAPATPANPRDRLDHELDTDSFKFNRLVGLFILDPFTSTHRSRPSSLSLRSSHLLGLVGPVFVLDPFSEVSPFYLSSLTPRLDHRFYSSSLTLNHRFYLSSLNLNPLIFSCSSHLLTLLTFCLGFFQLYLPLFSS